MSAKIKASRRRAFLDALAASGNVTLSAEKARVSRSWVCLQRSGDAGFDAACRAAIAGAKARLIGEAQVPPHPPVPAGAGPGPSLSRKGRGAKWRFADGVELVVSGTNGRRTQIRRARLHQWTPRVEERFLSALAASCNARAARAAVGMSKGSTYAHRKRSPAFAQRWQEAIAIGTVRLELGLVESADRFFDPHGTPIPVEPLHGMSVAAAIQLLAIYHRKLGR